MIVQKELHNASVIIGDGSVDIRSEEGYGSVELVSDSNVHALTLRFVGFKALEGHDVLVNGTEVHTVPQKVGDAFEIPL